MGQNKKMTPSRRKTEKRMAKVVDNYNREQRLKKIEQERLNNEALNELPASKILQPIQQNA